MSVSRQVLGGPRGASVILLAGGEAAADRGVVLCPEVRGVDANIEDYAARLLDEGYRVAVVDPWARHGGPPALDAPEAISAAVARLDDGLALADVGFARDCLGAVAGAAVLGFCLGGLHARLAAACVPGFHAAVEFYGRIVYPTLTPQKPVQPLDLLPGRRAALLCHFGTADPAAPAAHVDELERRLAFQPIPARVHRYPGCGHGFANPASPSGNAEAATLAWSRSLRWLDEHLPGGG